MQKYLITFYKIYGVNVRLFYAKKIVVIFILLATMQNSFAYIGYSPTLFSPSWFASIWQGFFERDKEVWRGTVTDVVDGKTLLIKNSRSEKITEVTLLHLEPKGESSVYALESMIGKYVYVLGKPNVNQSTSRILGSLGEDINLSLIKNNTHLANTTSLYFSENKIKYLR